MKQAVLVIGWILVIAGGMAVVAGIAHSFWALWSLGAMALLNILPVLLVLSGMFVAGIGLAIIAWNKSAN